MHATHKLRHVSGTLQDLTALLCLCQLSVEVRRQEDRVAALLRLTVLLKRGEESLGQGAYKRRKENE